MFGIETKLPAPYKGPRGAGLSPTLAHQRLPHPYSTCCALVMVSLRPVPLLLLQSCHFPSILTCTPRTLLQGATPHCTIPSVTDAKAFMSLKLSFTCQSSLGCYQTCVCVHVVSLGPPRPAELMIPTRQGDSLAQHNKSLVLYLTWSKKSTDPK